MSSQIPPKQSIYGVSSDAREESVSLTIVAKHLTVLNCCDAENRRWSLIRDEEDLQPRCVVFNSLPHAAVGETLKLETHNLPVLFDVSLPEDISFNSRWAPLVREWALLEDDPELESLAEESKTAQLYELSGFGPGLTPAGDDFITGWITANKSTGGVRQGALLKAFEEEWNPDVTTWLSRWMIQDALAGNIWKRGKELLLALEADEASKLTEALSCILNWGHTSGRAWLAGLCRGFEDLEVI